MTDATGHDEGGTLLVGYDGSPDAAGAIELGARLLPGRRATIAQLWVPPYFRTELRARLNRRRPTPDELIAMLEREGQAEAARVAAEGVALARAAGWTATPLLRRSLGGEGLELASIAGELTPDALVVGSRGLTGMRAVLGSVSDEVVHASPVPVLVVPRLILTTERDAIAEGPVLVGVDGSEGAAHAAEVAGALFGGRTVITATVADVGARQSAEELVRRAGQDGAAVLAVGSRGRSAAREILVGSFAMALLHHADRPVLVVPARAPEDGAR